MSLVLLLELLRINVLDTGKERKWAIRQFDYKCLSPMYVDQVFTYLFHFFAMLDLLDFTGSLTTSPPSETGGSNSRIRSAAAELAIRPTSCGQRRRRAGIVLGLLRSWRKIRLAYRQAILNTCNQYLLDEISYITTRLSNFTYLKGGGRIAK